MEKYYRTELIENFRKENGWSISRFFNECKIGIDVYYKIINQQLNFRLTALFKIARIMKVHVYQLCY